MFGGQFDRNHVSYTSHVLQVCRPLVDPALFLRHQSVRCRRKHGMHSETWRLEVQPFQHQQSRHFCYFFVRNEQLDVGLQVGHIQRQQEGQHSGSHSHQRRMSNNQGPPQHHPPSQTHSPPCHFHG